MESISRDMGAVAIFISHSSQDQHLADALTELLKNAMEIDPQAIRCTIVEGHGLPAGVNSGEQLKEELLGAKSFIALLTPHSLSSTWVLFEMGARWGKGLKLIPILAAGLTHKQLGGPLPDIHAISCESDSDLHKLVRILSDGTGATLRPAEFYSRYLAALQNKSRDLARTHDSSGQKAKLATIGQPDSSARLKPAPHIIQLPARSAWVRIDDFCYRETKEAFTRAVIAVYENEVQDSEKIGDVQYVAGKIICSDEHGQELSELRVNQGCWMNAGNEVNFLPNTRHELIIAIKEQRQYQILREAFKYGSVRNTQFAHEKLFVTVQLIAKNEVLHF